MMTGKSTPGPWLRIDTADYAEIHAAFRPSSQAIALVGKPEDADLIAAAPDLLEVAKSMLPANVCITNPNVRDDTIIPLDVTIGELRKIAAAIARATQEAPHG